MCSQLPVAQENQTADGRTQRRVLLAIWGLIGSAGLGVALYGENQLGYARASLAWPVVPGKIVVSRVSSFTDDDGTTRHTADIEYRYHVGNTEYSSTVVVLGGHNYHPHSVVKRYPVGKPVVVSFDPQWPGRAVLEPGVESYFLRILGIGMMIGALFNAVLFNFILRRALGEEPNALDSLLIFCFRVVFFPVTIGGGNVWLLAGISGVSVYLANRDLNLPLTIVFSVIAVFYGLILILLLWVRFLGWLGGLADPTD